MSLSNQVAKKVTFNNLQICKKTIWFLIILLDFACRISLRTSKSDRTFSAKIYACFPLHSSTVSTFGVTPTVTGLSAGTVGEASTALSSAAQVALQSLSHAMVSAEQQLQVLQEKQQQLLKLQQQVRHEHILYLF